MLHYVHNTFAYTALYTSNIYAGADTSVLWGIQAFIAAMIRCLELYINYMVLLGMAKVSERQPLRIATIIGCVMVTAGRIYEVFGNLLINLAPSDFKAGSTIRWGMAIVASGGIVQSIICLWILKRIIRQLRNSPTYHEKANEILSHSAFYSID
jgi:hypothetical protein